MRQQPAVCGRSARAFSLCDSALSVPSLFGRLVSAAKNHFS
jgi:hypothetical protein